ncbi:hypothetical protein [Mucilaginibacter ginsenosidivorans]|uniref:Uncharacterized protein n=1 Tax=Mucilaginibacter ginsenosidivorans TaxID=398053 RepID=A0A5B8UQD6_9SPHI|nr:hypothetical protein [Mucilaginibacter ginsenosidivorans]QEC61239.1 hypothetical protein FRZ54_01115 [Mucilaginibacter ginsenosidivorans]
MCKAKIRLVYRQIMDESSQTAFEKAILQASYQEFLLKSQAYNPGGKFKTFSKMKTNDGRANSLHYKLDFSVGHFIAQLDHKMPLVKDNLGNKLLFETARFELIESHIEDISLHKVAINFETAELSLVELFGEYMLLTYDDPANVGQLQTFVLRMQPDLSIVSYHEVTNTEMA